MQILTSKGFRKFDGFICNGKKEVGDVTLNGKTVSVTRDHNFWIDGKKVEAQTFEMKNCRTETVYDAFNVDDGHEYLTNGIPSSNCDEFAWVQDDVTFYTATYPVVSSGSTSKIIITSTPNGMNLFYKLWTEATTGKNAYVWDESFWYEHPARDEEWKATQLRNMDQRQFDQEFDTKFYGSSDTLISGNKLQQMTFREPIKILNDNRDFKIFEDPKPDRSYVITVDVSEGVGKDYSVMTVIDVTEAPFQQVAMMRSNIMSPLILADLVNRYGIAYNNAVVIVESNTYGKQTVDSLWYDYEYDNMLITQQHQSESKVASGGRKAAPGVKTTKKSKMLGCSTLKGLIESNQLIIHDFDTVQELTTFVKKGPSYEAEKGKYDDIAMSLVIFAWFTAQPYFQDMVDLNVRQLVRENLTQNEEYSTAFGFMDDGLENPEDNVSVELFLSLRKN